VHKKTLGTFQAFIKPRNNPVLTEEEIKKLNIQQDQINNAKDLAIVLDEFDSFLNKHVISYIDS
jgi:inhibitor of KinA sporulation pathway (predicted exonuclease)